MLSRATRFINNGVLFYVRFIFAHDVTHCTRAREGAFINAILRRVPDSIPSFTVNANVVVTVGGSFS